MHIYVIVGNVGDTESVLGVFRDGQDAKDFSDIKYHHGNHKTKMVSSDNLTEEWQRITNKVIGEDAERLLQRIVDRARQEVFAAMKDTEGEKIIRMERIKARAFDQIADIASELPIRW